MYIEVLLARDTGSIKEVTAKSEKKKSKTCKKIKGRAFLTVGEIMKFTPVPEINCRSIVKIYQIVPHSLSHLLFTHCTQGWN